MLINRLLTVMSASSNAASIKDASHSRSRAILKGGGRKEVYTYISNGAIDAGYRLRGIFLKVFRKVFRITLGESVRECVLEYRFIGLSVYRVIVVSGSQGCVRSQVPINTAGHTISPLQ